jgi:hypothetical protein
MTITADATPIDRLQAALADPDHLFTREQVAYLMGEAARWAREAVEGEPSELSWRSGYEAGYRARVAEENAEYPPPPVSIGGRWVDQVTYRRQCDADGRRRRRGDYRGGPVREWGPSWCGDADADGVAREHGPHVDRYVLDEGSGETRRFRCEGRRG